MRTVTVKQLASELNVEYADAAGLMRIMVAQNAAKVVGTQRNTTATGRACKPSTVYEVPNSFTIDLVSKDPLFSDVKRLAEIGNDSPMTEQEKAVLVG